MRNRLAAAPDREKAPTLAGVPAFLRRIADTDGGQGGRRPIPALAATDRRRVTSTADGIMPASPRDDSLPAVRSNGCVGSRAAVRAGETGEGTLRQQESSLSAVGDDGNLSSERKPGPHEGPAAVGCRVEQRQFRDDICMHVRDVADQESGLCSFVWQGSVLHGTGWHHSGGLERQFKSSVVSAIIPTER
jgi:hypothetical protein